MTKVTIDEGELLTLAQDHDELIDELDRKGVSVNDLERIESLAYEKGLLAGTLDAFIGQARRVARAAKKIEDDRHDQDGQSLVETALLDELRYATRRLSDSADRAKGLIS